MFILGHCGYPRNIIKTLGMVRIGVGRIFLTVSYTNLIPLDGQKPEPNIVYFLAQNFEKMKTEPKLATR